jgi:FHS family L-fucose permease-like MFS transporter
MLILVLFFEGACFATIYTLGLRGLGRHTKRGGSMLVAAISGGAAIPPATGALATSTGNFHTAMAIPTAFYVAALAFPIYANTINRKVLDGHRMTDLNVAPAHNAAKTVEEARGDSVAEDKGANTIHIDDKM